MQSGRSRVRFPGPDQYSGSELRNEGTPFALKAAGPSRVSDDHVKWRSRLR